MKKLRVYNCLMAAVLLLIIGSSTAVYAEEHTKLSEMTLEEKVAQLFFVTPQELTGADRVTIAGEVTKEAFAAYPVGGIIYFTENIESGAQFLEMTATMQEISMERLGIPVFLGMDEEGGRVARLYESGIDDIPHIAPMLEIGAEGDPENAYDTGALLAGYLAEYGINVDFAPVADIFSNPENTVISDRSFGRDAETVASMVPEMVKGLQDNGVNAVLKHFPGHGDTAKDSHEGFAVSYKTLEELRRFELEPFKAGIDAGSRFVMAGHISLPMIVGNNLPASLSREMIMDELRGKLGFSGVIITDAMNMGAIVNYYDSGEAAVLALEAGVDMILMPEDFRAAYTGVLEAVADGRLSVERIDASVKRILAVKQSLE